MMNQKMMPFAKGAAKPAAKKSGAFKPCASCKMPGKCKAAGQCLGKAKTK